MEASPSIDKLESDLIESKEKVKVMNETNSKLELKLNDVIDQLKLSNTQCEEYKNKIKILHSTENDLSKQVYLKNLLS